MLRRALLVVSGVLLSLCLADTALAQKVRVTMISSATQVTVGDPFAIEIRVDLAGDDVDDIALPDFGKLEVLGRRVSRPMSFSFGFGSGGQHAQVQSQIVHGFTLRALAPGSYVVQPAIVSVGGRKYASQKLTIVASGAALLQPPSASPQPGDPSAAPDGDQSIAPPEGSLDGARYDNDLFLRTVVDKRQVYVGEQVTVTVYLYVHGGLSQNPSITREPTMEGFWVQDLLPVQRSLSPVRQDVNGRTFNVYVMRRFAAFPLRSGKLEVGTPAVEISAGNSIFDLLTGPSESVRRNGVNVPIEALPLPAHSPADARLHVGTLTLEASLDPTSAKVGDAVTLRVLARGQGNLKALKLPDPRLEGFDVLAPEIQDKVTTDLDIVGGERVFRWLLLPRKVGAYQLAPFEVSTFDREAKVFHSVRSAALSLLVAGAPDAPTSTAAAPSAGAAAVPAVDQALSFGPARAEAQLGRAPTRLLTQGWFVWAVLAGPLSCLGLLLGNVLLRGLRKRRAGNPSDQALRAAELKLKEAAEAARKGDRARAYAALFSAVRGALHARLHEPVGGLTSAALRQHCIDSGMAGPLAERIVTSLASAEQSRFDPERQTSEALEAHIADGRAIIRDIARFSAKGAA